MRFATPLGLRAWLFGCVVLGVVLGPPVAAGADGRSSGPGASFTDKRLDNGMTVVVQEDHRAPLVALALRYDAGERAAPPGKAGTAALTTFLMLRATKHVPPGAYYRLLTGAGASTMTDTTTLDATLLQVSLPSDRLELPLWLWSDQMGFFDEGLTQEGLEEQRSTIEAQRRTWLDTAPLSRLDAFVEEALWPEEHPYHRAIPGSPGDIHGIDREGVRTFHREWITPEHATLAIVGDVVAADAFALVERYFGPIHRSEAARRIERPPPVTLPGQVQVDVSANVPVARVVVSWPTPRFMSTEDARLDILARVLQGRRTAWLYWSLVDDKKVARRVWVHQYSRDLGSRLEVSIDGLPGKSPTEILAAFDATMDEIGKRQATQGVVGMAVYEQLVGPAVDLESPLVRARKMTTYTALVGTPDYFTHDFERYSKAAPEAVHDAIVKFMPSDRRVVLLVAPDPGAPVGGVRRGQRLIPAGATP